jgi:hypothetical protein
MIVHRRREFTSVGRKRETQHGMGFGSRPARRLDELFDWADIPSLSQ